MRYLLLCDLYTISMLQPSAFDIIFGLSACFQHPNHALCQHVVRVNKLLHVVFGCGCAFHTHMKPLLSAVPLLDSKNDKPDRISRLH